MDTGTESGADTAGSASSTHTSFSGDTSANRPSLDEIRARARDIQNCAADVFAGVDSKDERWWNIRSWESRLIVGVVEGSSKEAEEHQFLHFCTELRLDPKTDEKLKGGRIATEGNALSGAAAGAASTSNFRSIKDHMERNFKKDREGTQHTIKDQQVESRGGDKGHAIFVSEIDKTLSDEVIDVTLSDDETKDLEETEGAGGSRGNAVVDMLHQGVTIDLSHDDDNAEAALSTEQNEEKLTKTTAPAKSKGKAKGKGRKSSTACVVGGDDDVSGKATAAGESAGKTISSGVKDETVEEGTGEGGGNGKGRLCSAVRITAGDQDMSGSNAPTAPTAGPLFAEDVDAKRNRLLVAMPSPPSPPLQPYQEFTFSGGRVFVNDFPEEMTAATKIIKNGQSERTREQAASRLKNLQKKIFSIGVGDTVELANDKHPSKRRVVRVFELREEDRKMRVQLYYRNFEVHERVSSEMLPGEILKTKAIRTFNLSELERKVAIATEKPSNKRKRKAGSGYFCTRGINAEQWKIIPLPADINEPVPVGQAHQAHDILNVYWKKQWSPSARATEAARLDHVWLPTQQYPDELMAYLGQAVHLVPVKPDMVVYVRRHDPSNTGVDASNPPQWGLVSGEGPEGVISVEGFAFDRQQVLVIGAHQFAVDVLSKACGNVDMALKMMSAPAYQLSFLESLREAFWTPQQMQELCNISSQLHTEGRMSPLGDVSPLGDEYDDAANFGVEGKRFADVVDALHRFKPSRRLGVETSGTPAGSGGASSGGS